jgi:hypothetical protein
MIMESKAILLHGNKEAFASLKPLLEESGINFKEKQILRFGVSANAGNVIEIIQAIGGLGIAGVLIAWVNARSKRFVYITTKDNKVEIISQGYSAKQANHFIEQARDINLAEVPGEEDKT